MHTGCLCSSFVQGLVEESHTFEVGGGGGRGWSQTEEHLCQPTPMLVLAAHHYKSCPLSIPCQPWTLSGTDLPLPGGPLVSLGPVL